MDTIGVDLHKRESQIRIVTTSGQTIDHRIATTRERFTHVFWGRPRMRILVEASTESEWVARHLESLGHAVIVADPGFAPMYATRSRRLKTDKRDARALCEAYRLGAYRAIHRVSDAQRHVRAELAVRDALVRTRTRYVALHDSGILINPMIVDGQVHGGIVHGIGNALFEWMGYDGNAIALPYGGIWAGLAKSLPREIANCNVKVLDVADATPDAVANLIAEEARSVGSVRGRLSRRPTAWTARGK